MLSKIVVLANLLMLAKAGIEMPFSKVLNLPKKVLQSMDRHYLRPIPIKTEGGTQTVFSAYIAEIVIANLTYRVIIDTGSSDLTMVGEHCVTFKPGPTCYPQTPAVGVCNTGGSPKKNSGNYTGKEGSDCYGIPGDFTFTKYEIYTAVVTMAGVQAHNQHLGYIYEQTVDMWGSGENAVDGIMGLAYSRLSNIYNITGGAGKTLMSTISLQNDFPNSFAMCFDPSGDGGKMVLGEGELVGMQFTPLILDAWYTVITSSISIDGRSLPHTKNLETIVDSGTTLLIVPGQVLEEFALQLCPVLKTIEAPCPFNPQQRQYVPENITVTAKQLATLPNITISLLGATLVVPPQSYFIYYSPASGMKQQYFYGIASNGFYETPVNTVAVILGDVALMGHWVFFDTDKLRVGFSGIEHCDQQY